MCAKYLKTATGVSVAVNTYYSSSSGQLVQSRLPLLGFVQVVSQSAQFSFKFMVLSDFKDFDPRVILPSTVVVSLNTFLFTLAHFALLLTFFVLEQTFNVIYHPP